jgi:serine/threonine-protein kinase
VGRPFLILATFLSACSAARAHAEPSSPNTLIYPTGLALDRHGALFVSDVGAHRIFKLDPHGQLTIIAGTGAQGFAGDDGPATAAQLAAPTDLTFDPDGNLLVADTYNHRVRRIDPHGVITTIVGNGKTDYSNKPAPALEVSLNNPQSLSLDPDGNLFIADTYNHVIRRLDRSGAVTTFAGSEPGLAGDKGLATKAQLNLPQAVAVAPDGSVYISDSANSRIRRVTPDGIIQTIAGSGPGSGEGGAGFAGDGGPADKAKLFSPADIKFNELGQLYFSDTGNNRVRLIAYGTVLTIAGSGKPGYAGDGGRATQAMLNTPQKLSLAPDGSIYIADRVNRRVRKIDPRGLITTVAGASPSPGVLIDPAVLPDKAPEKRE